MYHFGLVAHSARQSGGKDHGKGTLQAAIQILAGCEQA